MPILQYETADSMMLDDKREFNANVVGAEEASGGDAALSRPDSSSTLIALGHELVVGAFFVPFF